MAESLAPERVLELLEQSPKRIEEITSHLTAEQLRATPEPGEWSAVEVLAHLRSCADVWGGCIATILGEDKPTFRAVNPTTWIENTDYRELDFAPSWLAFRAQREHLLDALRERAPAAWARTATVTGGGRARERSVLLYAEWLATHERGHVKQFAKIAASVASAR
ncbi:MAG: DinB family protein [Frankia sp.]|nr:DinB family protein [Frankia sp.]